MAARRTLESLVVLLVVSALTFFLVNVVPGNPGRNALGPQASAEQVESWNAAHGVRAPSPELYLDWLQGFVTGQWGTSLVYGAPVFDLVMERFTNSFWLGILAFAIMAPIAIGVGVLQARARSARVDRTTTVGLMVLAAVPDFVLGALLLVTFGVVFDVFPIQSGALMSGGAEQRLRAMMLPALTLALGTVSIVARTTRAGIIDERRAYHYRVAELSGVPERTLLTRYVARNAMLPTVALLGLCFGVLVAGSAVVETLYGYPGLGELLVTATQKKDTAVLTAGVVVTGAVSLTAIAVTDVMVTALGPWRSGRRVIV
ncbi:ABC transporter permease [Microbacterium koreense]